MRSLASEYHHGLNLLASGSPHAPMLLRLMASSSDRRNGAAGSLDPKGKRGTKDGGGGRDGTFDENYEDEDEKFPSETHAPVGTAASQGDHGPPPGFMFISGGATASGQWGLSHVGAAYMFVDEVVDEMP